MSNLLIEVAPNLIIEWHSSKNSALDVSKMVAGSKKKVWWIGKECKHEWEAAVANRVRGTQCPICNGKKVLIGFNDFATTCPELTLEWHPTKNIMFTPLTLTKGSNKKVWWLGKDCQHEWEDSPAYRSTGSNCPYCSGRTVLLGFNDLATTDAILANEWHPTNNNKLTPKDVTYRTGRKVWWLGKDCNHEWQATVAHRALNYSNCPICSNQQIVIGFNDLASQNPSLATKWHPTKNGDVLPNQVTQWSKFNAWWLCSDGHEWQTRVSGRHGCPTCSGQKVLAGFNDLASNNQFLSKQWHPTKNGELIPSQITMGSNKRIWWLCENKHEWLTTVCDRNRGYGCPKCSKRISQAELDITDFLKENTLYVEQSNRSLIGKELDIYIPSHKLAIEYNGLYWHTENQGKDSTYHQAKYLACKALGIQLVQIWEDEWKKNPEQIKAMLLHKLGITQQEKVFARKTIITQLKKPEIEAFLEQHHVQGYAAGSYYLGLREKSTDELVSVLVLKKETNNTLNIIRYATSKNVVGGFTKLLKYAEQTYKPSRFITFSDHCVSDGGLYENNGFTNDKELSPDYRYVVNGERQHKFGYRLKRFKNDPNLKYEEGLTERELAALNGLPRIWDAGKTRWVKMVNPT